VGLGRGLHEKQRMEDTGDRAGVGGGAVGARGGIRGCHDVVVSFDRVAAGFSPSALDAGLGACFKSRIEKGGHTVRGAAHMLTVLVLFASDDWLYVPKRRIPAAASFFA
jgi:hypothetical protein